MHFIYKITNLINLKLYVGKATNIIGRWRRHRYNASHDKSGYLYDAIRCYGKDNFVIETIETCTENEVNDREVFWIKELHSYVGDPKCWGYNLTPGGDGGNTWKNNQNKEKTSALLSLKNKGKKRNPEVIENMKKGWEKRDPPTEKTKEKISGTLKKKFKSGEIISSWSSKSDHKHPSLGKQRDQKTRDKISKSNKGKKLTKEHIEKRTASLKASGKLLGNQYSRKYKKLSDNEKNALYEKLLDKDFDLKKIAQFFDTNVQNVRSAIEKFFNTTIEKFRGKNGIKRSRKKFPDGYKSD